MVTDSINGKDIYELRLSNDRMSVRVTNIGCAIMGIYVPDRWGRRRNVVAGFRDPAEYMRNPWYFGCVVGRCVNRIGGARFVLDGTEVGLSRNDGKNHLHGGFAGLHTRVWDVLDAGGEEWVEFAYNSPDGEEGYPGNLHIRVRYSLDAGSRLSLEYMATTDKKTPVNLSNHSYFNLSGFDLPDVRDHLLRIPAERYTEKDGANLPTGRILPVEGTALDFREERRIGSRIGELVADRGFDHNYVTGSADLYEPVSGRRVRVETDRPGIQLYTANWWDGTLRGDQGAPYVQHGAVALETQAFPDSPNRPEFPDVMLMPGEEYRARTAYIFDSI